MMMMMIDDGACGFFFVFFPRSARCFFNEYSCYKIEMIEIYVNNLQLSLFCFVHLQNNDAFQL